MSKNMHDDACTLIDGLRKCVLLMEEENLLLEREVEALRKNKDRLEKCNTVLCAEVSLLRKAHRDQDISSLVTRAHELVIEAMSKANDETREELAEIEALLGNCEFDLLT